MPVHIATPSEIGGSLGTDEIRVYHRTGPHSGKMLVNKINDPTLVTGFDSGDVLIEGVIHGSAGVPSTPDYPNPMRISAIDPKAGATSMANLLLTVTGENFADGMVVRIGNIKGTGLVVNDPQSLNVNVDLRTAPVGTLNFSIYRDEDAVEPDDTTIFNVTAAAALENTVAPSITGTPQVGQTLTAVNGTWTGSPSFTYAWLANDVPIAGETSGTLSLVAGHEGANIKVRVTGTNAGGSLQATSAAVGPVAPAA